MKRRRTLEATINNSGGLERRSGVLNAGRHCDIVCAGGFEVLRGRGCGA